MTISIFNMQFTVPEAGSYRDGISAACCCAGGAWGRESVLGEVLLHLTCSRELETRNTSDKRERKEKKRNMGMKLVFCLTYYHPGNKHSFLLLPILTSCRGQLWVMDLTAIDKKVKEQTWSAMCLTTCISGNLSFSVPCLPRLLCVNDFRLWLPKFVPFGTNSKYFFVRNCNVACIEDTVTVTLCVIMCLNGV